MLKRTQSRIQPIVTTPSADRVELSFYDDALRKLHPSDLTRIKRAANGYYRGHRLSGTRSLVVELIHPVLFKDRIFLAVKIKGGVDSTSGKRLFPDGTPFPGYGGVHLLTALKDGGVYNAPTSEGPRGLLYGEALNEARFTREAFEDGEDVNWVLGHGKIKGVSFTDSKSRKHDLGVVLMAVENIRDERLTDQMNNLTKPELLDLSRLYGAALRRFNAKRFHSSPAPWNFTLSRDGKRVVAHDLEGGFKRSDLTKPQAATQQALDVLQALFLFNRSISPALRRIRDANVLTAFLKGYFHDLSEAELERTGLVKVTGDLFALKHSPDEVVESKARLRQKSFFSRIDFISGAVFRRSNAVELLKRAVERLPENSL